jgi:GNAT superfamily N-acetyltransferase
MKRTTIHLRFAAAEDAALVADLSRKTFYESFAPQNTEENMRLYMDQQFTREMQMAEVGAPGRTFILAYVDGEAVGYASMRTTLEKPRELQDEKAIEIVQLYSEQRMIGKGVGPALMQACVELAQEQGYDWIWLGVWEHNHRAQAFYTKWGFERFGEHLFIVGLDAQTDWWMRKKL